MRLTLDPSSVADYETFLKVKALPQRFITKTEFGAANAESRLV